MSSDILIISLAFAALILATLTRRGPSFFHKSRQDWIVDTLGLTVQGTLIPILQTYVLIRGLQAFAPQWRGGLVFSEEPWLDAALSFCVNFLIIDYLYYWNHRWLHTDTLWPAHALHHSVQDFDVLGTSRNTLWTSALILYLWFNALFIFLLRDPRAYILAAALTASLDLWRHSELQPWPWLERLLSPIFILPRDHAWHHASEFSHCNFGANLKLWDQLHGTWKPSEAFPESLGVPSELSLTRQLLWPYP